MRTAEEMAAYMIKNGIAKKFNGMAMDAMDRVSGALHGDEEVYGCFMSLCEVSGSGGGNCIIALTDRRMIIVQATFKSVAEMVAFPLDMFRGISTKKKLLGQKGIVVDLGTDTVIATPLMEYDFIYNLLNDAMYEARRPRDVKPDVVVPEPAPAAAPAPAMVDEILRLKGLLDAGIITEAEFAAGKAKLLGL